MILFNDRAWLTFKVALIAALFLLVSSLEGAMVR